MYKPSVRICIYKDWLILTLLQVGPKIKSSPTGIVFSSFFAKDLEMSQDAADWLKQKMIQPKHAEYGIEFMSKSSIFWAIKDRGIILPPTENVNVYQMPLYTLCNNDIDPYLQTEIDKQSNLIKLEN